MRLWLDPMKMVSYNITFQEINNALNRENVELPGGKISGNATELTVKTFGRLTTEEDFNDLIVRQTENQIVRLRDVGQAVLGPENEETILKRDGVPMVALALVPQPGSNYVSIADEFYKRYEQIKKDIPADYNVDIIYDSTQFIKSSIYEVKETLLIAFLLVVIIIYLFFRDWLIALRPIIDIPVSLLGAFFIMYMFGFTINVLTLLAIVLATGLVVDDGIVVTENIFKKLELGFSKEDAAREGSEEIFFAVIATSITLAVVFLPIIFLQGFVGSLFREFGIVVAGAVLISAFVSLSLTPVLNVLLTRKDQKKSWFYTKTEPFFEALDSGYKSLLSTFMQRRWTSLLILAVCVFTIVLFGKLLPSELAPLEDRSQFRLSVTAPEGTSYDYMEKFMNRIAYYLVDSVPGKRQILTVTAPGFAGSGGANTGFARVSLVDPSEREFTQQELVDKVNKGIRQFSDGKVFAIQEQTISTGGTARFGLPVQFVVQNMDFEKIKTALPKFMEEAQKSPVFMATDLNLKFNKPELQVEIDRIKATDMGVSVMDISNTLQLAFSGRRLGYFTMNGRQYQVIGQVSRENRDDPVDLKSLYVGNSHGEMIQLDNFVTMKEVSSPPQLYHYNRFKSATVSASVAPGKTIGDGIAEMERISKLVLDESFSTDLSGSSRDFSESSSNTMFAFILALILVYLILAAQFESFIDPMVIMLTVPLALAGALFSLWMFNQTLNIFSQIGIIMLIGLVTKNGILIVEFANHKRDEGLGKVDAVIEASVMRLRPILMTSIATALGAVPIALALGAGAQSRIPLGIVIIGGIMFSLVLTLFVIPAMYSYLSRKRKASSH